ncbi:thioredoxin domain-containing protein 6 [Apodemus sylvaticus]|uniref:thioredoxin domain-containing protein 6 n=1 Tax=Apodemus sylvaticus TaxID=10129 RepID=UPI00224385FA|nr:thioredoxin domain-containing protein 6 [Apodemus sylvaticus]
MGNRKKEIALQVNINTQELWEEMLGSKGLTVVDVYQGWCGPCKPVVSLFQKMRIEVGLDLLHFAMAEADRLDVLEKYRGKCEPTFLFYAVTDEDLLSAVKWPPRRKDGGEDGDIVSSGKTCTLGIIKPDAVAHGKADEIIMKIQEAGFDILLKEERTLTEAEMQVFYQHRAREEAFEKLVHHMCSGPSHLLILTKTEGAEDVVTAWRTFLGPCDPNVARREHPDSLRAQYGTEMPFNAVHGSRDREVANRELRLLFPSFKFSDKDMEDPQGHLLTVESLEVPAGRWQRGGSTLGAVCGLPSLRAPLPGNQSLTLGLQTVGGSDTYALCEDGTQEKREPMLRDQGLPAAG